jgi:S-adenosylmethionine synthetase
MLENAVRDVFDLRPREIIEVLGLKRPIFRRTAAYGHFGREPDEDGGFSWERLNRVQDLLDAV